MSDSHRVCIAGVRGLSVNRDVLLGFAPANLLHSLSFADVLDEETGRGYQRSFNHRHSLDFRRYITGKQSSTIPLTFNLRPESQGSSWCVRDLDPPQAILEIDSSVGKVLVQVDCQHRLGYLNDLGVSLPFMCYLGLNERDEMEIFNVINSKAKGLNTSLLDFHEATLTSDLAAERPELFIALHLNNEAESPWHRQLGLGGRSTSGLMRRASLRTMQKALKRFLAQSHILEGQSVDRAAQTVLDFWAAVAVVLRAAWDDPRRHLVNKGVGVYALMSVAADLYQELPTPQPADRRYFAAKLAEFMDDIDWSTNGPLSGFGGERGVKTVLSYVRKVRKDAQARIVNA